MSCGSKTFHEFRCDENVVTNNWLFLSVNCNDDCDDDEDACCSDKEIYFVSEE